MVSDFLHIVVVRSAVFRCESVSNEWRHHLYCSVWR